MYRIHEKKVEVIRPCRYKELLQTINYRKNGMKRKDVSSYDLYMHQKWINSIIYINHEESYLRIVAVGTVTVTVHSPMASANVATSAIPCFVYSSANPM